MHSLKNLPRKTSLISSASIGPLFTVPIALFGDFVNPPFLTFIFLGRAPPLPYSSYGARRGTATFTLACSYCKCGGSGHSLQVLAAQTLSVLTSIQPFAYIIS